MIKAVVIDDEKNNLELIVNLLNLYCKNVDVCGTANSVETGYKLIFEQAPELIFLDVQMQDGTGFDLLKLFPKIGFKVIFVTAHQEFAIEAFKVSALDYLMKPVSPAHVIAAVAKAEELISQEELNVKFQALLNNVGKQNGSRKKIILKTQERIYSVELHTIIRFESDGNYTKVFLSDGNRIMVTKLIKEFDEMLAGDGFIRVHQSHLINPEYLFFFEKTESMVVMKDKSKVPVSARKKDVVMEILNS